jgi:hypothetical protein
LAEKYNLEIEPGFVDEKKAGVYGHWNIVFRKKIIDNGGL